MRDYIILNGISSNTISGLLISTLPSISKPKQRTTVEEIDGRDGDIVTKLGYSAYDKELEIGLYGDFDIDEVIAYFNSEGTVTFSNEPDKFYNYQILDQIDYEKLIRFKTAKIKMHVQPFKYPLEETPVEITIQTVNDEAEEIDLDNTKEAPMQIDLKGNGGKNLFSGDYSQFSNTGGTGNLYAYFPLPNDNDYYTLTVIAKDDFTASRSYYIGFTGNGGDANAGVDWAVSTSSKTYTKGETKSITNKNWRYISIYPANQAELEALVEKFYIQLEKSPVATAYEPYGEKVTGANTIKVTGKNLFDPSVTTQNCTVNNGLITITTSSTDFYIQGTSAYSEANKFLTLQQGSYYVTSTNSNIRVSFYGTTGLDTASNQPITLSSETKLGGIRIRSLNANSLQNVTFGISISKTSGDFQPYTSASYPINLGSIGLNTGDSIQFLTDKWYIVRGDTTQTEITDTSLIEQLEALKNASSYDTKTHISQTNEKKPFILNATAIQKGSGEATVNNEGNIYSKPTLDIEGSGTVGIYLDGNQMFSVDLSNANECIIDTAQLEAYNPTTSELMNRQVTGDYSNFKLNAGDNQVQATGEITKVTISNYTRYL